MYVRRGEGQRKRRESNKNQIQRIGKESEKIQKNELIEKKRRLERHWLYRVKGRRETRTRRERAVKGKHMVRIERKRENRKG